MRISGGELGGRKIKMLCGEAVRPTQERVREALFSMLMQEIPDSVFIDLFAGSGAVGLEAYSRGARQVIWVEQARRHAALLRENVVTLTGTADGVYGMEVTTWIAGPGKGLEADIVFADPPYVVGQDQGFMAVMTALAETRVLRSGGIFAAEMPVARNVEKTPGWCVMRDRTYGHTRLVLYRLAGEPKSQVVADVPS